MRTIINCGNTGVDKDMKSSTFCFCLFALFGLLALVHVIILESPGGSFVCGGVAMACGVLGIDYCDRGE